MARINIVCSRCGGDNVMRDAWAVWDTENQEWELGNVFDNGFCDDCGGEASLKEVPYEEEKDEEQQA